MWKDRFSRPTRTGLVAAVLALALLLGLQYLWLRRLESYSAVAEQATLRNCLEAAGNEIESFYRGRAEGLLNLPPELFTEGWLKKAPVQWRTKGREGLRRLFLVDFTSTEFGSFLVYDEEEERLRTPLASDESLAMIVASAPWHYLGNRSREGMVGGLLRVEERDPAHRIVLNPISAGEKGVVGVAGMVLDEGFFRETLIPKVTRKAVQIYFPNQGEELEMISILPSAEAVERRRGSTEITYQSSVPFVFTDWQMSISPAGLSPNAWARASTALNMTLSVTLAGVLIGSLLLALRAADRSMHLSELKSDFVSNVSHELRTPLASIQVFAELLRSGRVSEAERVREYGRSIEAESRRLSRLIENVLDFSRIESDERTYQFAPGSLEEVVLAVLESFRVRASTKGFTVAYKEAQEELPLLAIDRDAIAQAIANLLDNAMKYAGESTQIEVAIEVEHEESALAVKISDHGIGIPPEEQARIFDRFHRVARGPVHDVQGSGLGLTIVQHIVRAHGGTITVDSRFGKGATFCIRLPLPEANS